MTSKGLSAAVYTQTTDVEIEVNGLMTYDRAMVKMDLKQGGRGQSRPVSAAAQGDGGGAHGADRARDVALHAGEAGGRLVQARLRRQRVEGRPRRVSARGARRARWCGPSGTRSDIWLRREFALPSGKPDDLRLLMHHDEDAEVYLNGVLAAKLPGSLADYRAVRDQPGGPGGAQADRAT